jgi:hypothetical protein
MTFKKLIYKFRIWLAGKILGHKINEVIIDA